MNRKEAPEHIKLIQAWLDGEKIQWFYSEAGTSRGVWNDFETDDEIHLHGGMEHRIKPKEPREFWIDTVATGGSHLEAFEQEPNRKDGWPYIKVREVLNES